MERDGISRLRRRCNHWMRRRTSWRRPRQAPKSHGRCQSVQSLAQGPALLGGGLSQHRRCPQRNRRRGAFQDGCSREHLGGYPALNRTIHSRPRRKGHFPKRSQKFLHGMDPFSPRHLDCFPRRRKVRGMGSRGADAGESRRGAPATQRDFPWSISRFALVNVNPKEPTKLPTSGEKP